MGHNNLGNALRLQGKSDVAMAAYHRALELQPNYAEAHNSLGNALKDQGKLDGAAAAYRRALELKPDLAEANNNLGGTLKDQGKIKDAIAAYRRALELKPNYAEAHNNLGATLYEQGRLREAEAAYRRALELSPDFAVAYSNLGNALNDQGRMKDAMAALRKALELSPDFADAHNNLGNVLKDQGALKEAVAAYCRALELTPDFAMGHNNLGLAFSEQGKLNEAFAAYRRALELEPDYAEAYSNLGGAHTDRGQLREAVAAYRRALELKPDYSDAHSNLIFIMNYDAGFSQADIFAESRRWDEIHGAAYREHERAPGNDRDPGRRLRVGYFSSDFREHSVAYFAEPLIARHDRRSFEVFCYAQVVKPDDTTERFRDLADDWCSTVGLSGLAVAERIRDDRIDILVDLTGHTGANRLPVFAAKPAPVQVTWLGYPNTTGLSAMDYRLTDAIADPDGVDDALYSETLVRLPNGFLCFMPAGNAPDIGDSPALSKGHVTFGSFNNLTKIRPEVVETWAHILHRVPGSRVLIKNHSLADEATRDLFLDMFATHGIDTERVQLWPPTASKSGHLGAYDRVDIALDPFPYNGTTTTCEALWMGVPVIALRGDRHSGRVGASLLTQIGLPDLIAETKDAYVETAVGLANAPDRLSGFRKSLRQRVQGSPLCDRDAFARDVEAAYREMWRHWCNGDRSRAGVMGADLSGH